MIDISIQIRKVTDKVKQYYSLFGYSTFTQFSSSYSKVNGIKRMGFEEIECVISDTARGTSIGFYPKNQLQNILYSLPLLIGLILIGLSKIELFTPYLTGDIDQTNVRLNFIQLLFGDLNTSFFSISFLETALEFPNLLISSLTTSIPNSSNHFFRLATFVGSFVSVS